MTSPEVSLGLLGLVKSFVSVLSIPYVYLAGSEVAVGLGMQLPYFGGANTVPTSDGANGDTTAWPSDE